MRSRFLVEFQNEDLAERLNSKNGMCGTVWKKDNRDFKSSNGISNLS